MSLFKSVVTVGGWTMLSRILGFTRDILIAHILGAGVIADAFFIAFKFPNLFRRLFGEGAMSAAFIPLYTRHLHDKGPQYAKKFAGSTGAILCMTMVILSLVAIVAMPWVMHIQAHGFLSNPAKFNLTVLLARMTFPYLFFMVMTAWLSGLLNAHGRFAAAAGAPILLNIVMITVMCLIYYGVFSLPGQAMAFGVSLAGLFQFCLLVYATAKVKLLPPVTWPKLSPDMKRLVKLMIPGIIGAGVIQINVLVGDLLATGLKQGSVSFLYYADRINQLPLGVIGVAVGVALLPLISRHIKAGHFKKAQHSQERAIEFSLLLTVPAAAAFAIIPNALVMTLFQSGSFSPTDAMNTALAMRAFALGLPAFVLIKAITPSFFAREDTRTPVKVAIITVILNFGLSLVLMNLFAHVGLALATSLSSWFNLITLTTILILRRHFILSRRILIPLVKILMCTLIMSICVWAVNLYLHDNFTGPLMARIFSLLGLIITGLVTYGAMAFLTGLLDKTKLKAQLGR